MKNEKWKIKNQKWKQKKMKNKKREYIKKDIGKWGWEKTILDTELGIINKAETKKEEKCKKNKLNFL